MPAYWRRQVRPNESHGPTPRQLRFIGDLGGDVEYAKKLATWQMASDYIDELKKNPPKTAPVRPPGTATSRQLDYIHSLGGDMPKAQAMSIDQASAYIQELKRKPKPQDTPSSVTPGTFVPEPAVHRPSPKSADGRLSLLDGLLDMVRDGYYAVRADESDPIVFVRVSRPNRGRLAGAFKVQTQHSDVLQEAAVRWPSGVWSIYKHGIVDNLMVLCVDPLSAAQLYGKLGHCMRCNKDLTDERSRHYGIGPECEKIWTDVIERVDEINDGHSYEWLLARGLAKR